MNLLDILSDHKSELLGMLIGMLLATLAIAGFIGRKKFTWLIHEIVKMYSANEKSWFSKKRIESGLAFVISQHGMLFWLAKKYDAMSTTDFIMWATLEFAVAGWMVQKIQTEKLLNSNVQASDNAEQQKKWKESGSTLSFEEWIKI